MGGITSPLAIAESRVGEPSSVYADETLPPAAAAKTSSVICSTPAVWQGIKHPPKIDSAGLHVAKSAFTKSLR
jgi:hypothetical protein